jgi:hypothetical protein
MVSGPWELCFWLVLARLIVMWLSVALAEAAIQSGFGAYFMPVYGLVPDLAGPIKKDRLTAGSEFTWRPRF